MTRSIDRTPANLTRNDMTHRIDESQRKAARIAGVAFLFAIAIVVFGNFYVLADIVVAGNAAETARNIIAHETRFRLSMVCNLLHVAGVAVLLSALYVILEPVNRSLALAAAFCRLIFAVIWGVTALNTLSALRLLGHGLYGHTPYLNVFGADQLQALARLNITGAFDAYYAGLPFFALASTICSYLWFKSGYIPRVLAAFGFAASAWCVVCAFVFLVFPSFNDTVNIWWFDTPMGLFEIALGFWLLFKGLRSSGMAETVPVGDRA